MLGVVVYSTFLVVGFFMATSMFRDQPFYVRIWLGLLLGTLGLMWGVIPFAFIFGFGIVSHILAILLFGGLTYLSFNKSTKILPILFDDPTQKSKKKKFVNPNPDTNSEAEEAPEPKPMPVVLQKLLSFIDFKWNKTFAAILLVTIPLLVLTGFILFSHVLELKPDGYYGGQSTYGDLSLHLGITTSIAEQGTFPPNYSIDPGTKLSYPFLVDSLSSSLMVFGSDLPLAMLFPSLILILTLIMGMFILTYEFLKNKGAAIMATLLFMVNGGLGFFYFLEANFISAGDDGKLSVITGSMGQNLTRMVTEYYHTPTNFNPLNMRWSNVICDMIIPQRTTLAGWTFVILAFWLLYKAISSEDKKYFIGAGIVGGLLPMINTHAFLGFAIIALVWGAVFLFQSKKMGTYIVNWMWLGIPLLIIALPQLFFWTFTQTGSQGFIRFNAGWPPDFTSINNFFTWLSKCIWPSIGKENFLWFWIKNVGIVFILAIPAIFSARKKMLSFMAGPIVLFIVANLITFQPNDYDNNKLFYIWFIFMIILVCSFVFSIYQRMEGMINRWIIIVLIVAIGTISGGMTIAREINSGGQIQQYDNTAIEVSKYVMTKTSKDALFLTGRQHLNPIAALAGRNIFLGTGLYLYFHGVNVDQRDADLKKMFAGGNDFATLSKQYGIDYVYISAYENNDYKPNVEFFRKSYPLAKSFGSNPDYPYALLFAISDRAITSLNVLH